MEQGLQNFFYLIAASLFIFAIKEMTHPRTAVRGNIMGSLGMLIAVGATLLDPEIIGYKIIIMGILAGSVVGVILAYRPPMTAIPQVVAIFNGFGGGASALAVGAVLEEALRLGNGETMSIQVSLAAMIAGIIGCVSFSGSAIAFGKLQGIINEKAVVFTGRHVINASLFVISLGLSVYFVMYPVSTVPFWVMFVLTTILGVLLTIPIGGADMPVVISLLNAYSGLAAAGYGWVLNNSILIIAGALVGAAGFILTVIMSRAMNRSLANIIFAGVSSEVVSGIGGGADAAPVKSASAEEIAMLLEDSRRVAIVPGYGMAVGQAQFAVQELTTFLTNRGTEVNFGIHPVAGRMPGHMNVLLAEANISYDMLKEMDEINPTFRQTDAVLVIGANDIVNPMARDNDPSNPIAGMPILNVDQARSVVIIKRSLSPGFAGVPNPLFSGDNVLMLFGDSKKMVNEITAALKEG